MTTPAVAWHGWANGDTALFISPLSDQDPRMALWLQIPADVSPVALFGSEDDAREVMSFLDVAIGQTAQANAELLRRLEAAT